MKQTSMILILNAAAALFLLESASSCAKISIDKPDQAEQYIDFATDVETKAPVESSADMDEFAVWAAYYTDGALKSEPMEGLRVYRRDGLWMYDDIQLWLDGDWHFEAFYPHPSVLTVNEVQQGKDALKVTFTYVFFLVPLRLAFALFVACLLNSKHHGLGLYRTAYYIPSIIGGSVAVSVVWKQIFGNDGVIMSILSSFGIQQQLSLLGNPKTSLAVIIIMGVWQFGSSMLIFLAALKQIPESLYESAQLDGAGRWKTFSRITLPMLTPTLFFNLILQIINGFRVFTETKVITDGGPLNSTLSYVLYLYRRAFNYFDMGYSCALAWVLIAIIGAFTIIIFKTQNQWVYYEDGRN